MQKHHTLRKQYRQLNALSDKVIFFFSIPYEDTATVIQCLYTYCTQLIKRKASATLTFKLCTKLTTQTTKS